MIVVAIDVAIDVICKQCKWLRPTFVQNLNSTIVSFNNILTLKAPPTICSRRHFKILSPFRKNKNKKVIIFH